MQRYSEKIVRYEALTDEGKGCEILERITYEKQPGVKKPAVVNRRFDLQTGEPLTRLSEVEFVVDATGARFNLQRTDTGRSVASQKRTRTSTAMLRGGSTKP